MGGSLARYKLCERNIVHHCYVGASCFLAGFVKSEKMGQEIDAKGGKVCILHETEKSKARGICALFSREKELNPPNGYALYIHRPHTQDPWDSPQIQILTVTALLDEVNEYSHCLCG